MTSRRRAVLRTVAALLVAVIVVGASGFLVYANVTSAAEREPLAEVADDPSVVIDYSRDSVVLTPASDANGDGLVFIAGAKIEPVAYAYKLSGLVDAGYTVVIVRPFLNFGLFETRPLSAFTGLAPSVSDWFVGGHSLGGVKACMYADSPDVQVAFVNKPDPYVNELGTKGIGEIATIGVAPAIANAVFNATGKRVQELPITPDKLV